MGRRELNKELAGASTVLTCARCGGKFGTSTVGNIVQKLQMVRVRDGSEKKVYCKECAEELCKE